MKSIKLAYIFGIGSLLIVLLATMGGCRKEPLVYSTSTDLNITGFLDAHPEQFSEFRKILGITGTAGFLDAYGAYTLFLPTNEGVKDYLQQVGKNSVEEVDVETLKGLVKFHLIEDTLTTPSFKDGKLPQLTMYGQFLVTGASNQDGLTSIRINRQANVVQPNIKAGNGFVHVIDHMLIPAKQTLYELVKSKPEYSIFTKALEETGLADSLNILPADNPDKNKAWFTLIAETDSVLTAEGFDTYEKLKDRYSNTDHPEDPKDSLHLYVAYHILPDVKYLADIVNAGSHATLAPSEVLTSKLQTTEVLINDDDFNGSHEAGVRLERNRSDISATNGVLHSSAPYTYNGITNTGAFAIKVRKPIRIDWDIAHFPEIEALPAYFLKGKKTFETKDLPEGITTSGENKWGVTYNYSGTSPAWWGDWLIIPLGLPFRNTWYEFTTPVIVKGKYKVWVNNVYYRKSSSQKTAIIQASVDGVPLPRTMDVLAKRPSGTDAELEAQGWKQYTNTSTSNNYNGRLLGKIDIKTTDRHKFRITFLSGSSGDYYFDVIQFIPADDPEQIWPRFNPDGTLAPKP